MNEPHWSSLVVDCFDLTKMKLVCEMSLRRRLPRILIKPEFLEAAMVQRTLSQAKHLIYVVINNPEQKTPGNSKFMGLPADAFDAEGFELSPMATTDPTLMLNDFVNCSTFLKSNLSTLSLIGWDMRECKLNDGAILTFFQDLASRPRPNYIRFSADQGLVSTLANKLCSIHTMMPYDVDIESNFKSISTADLLKVYKIRFETEETEATTES